MSGWLFATLAAALLQTIRTALQQRLKGRLSTNGAGFIRYAFGAPFSLGAVAVMMAFGVDLPSLSTEFLLRVALAGAAQIIGTFFLITAFAKRDFAIGTVYSKTEAIQVALISGIVLSEGLKPLAWVGMIVLLFGIVILATKGHRSAVTDLFLQRLTPECGRESPPEPVSQSPQPSYERPATHSALVFRQ